MDVTKAVEFKVDFADYNTEKDVNVTRVNHREIRLKQKSVDLDNGLIIQSTLQRDTTKQFNSSVTRVLPNDTYTMLAYEATTHSLKGEMTGTVTDGTFIPTSANKSIRLTPAKYDFVLFNSKVTRNGNNLTIVRDDADAALIGRTTQTITGTPYDQKVAFTMKHVGAKVKIKLIGFAPIFGVNAQFTSLSNHDIPGSSIYDASTGTWSIGTNTGLSTSVFGYHSTPTPYPLPAKYTMLSEDVFFMPGTDISKLKLTFQYGQYIYHINLKDTELTFNPRTPLILENNGSYTLNIKLFYHFLYLMSDGSKGLISETTFDGGTKTPIAVILSQSNHMAIALKDANNGVSQDWCTAEYEYKKNVNTHVVSDFPKALTTSATSGLEETWNASYSTNVVKGNKIKGLNPDFMSFYSAAHYNPGITYTGSPALQWYLPSLSDWTWVYPLGLGDRTSIAHFSIYYPWKTTLADVAFIQVDGERLSSKGGLYWSSSELKQPFLAYTDEAACVQSNADSFFLCVCSKVRGGGVGVRAFVKY